MPLVFTLLGLSLSVTLSAAAGIQALLQWRLFVLDSCLHSITHTHTSLRIFCIQRCFARLRWQHAEAWPLLTAVKRLAKVAVTSSRCHPMAVQPLRPTVLL